MLGLFSSNSLLPQTRLITAKHGIYVDKTNCYLVALWLFVFHDRLRRRKETAPSHRSRKGRWQSGGGSCGYVLPCFARCAHFDGELWPRRKVLCYHGHGPGIPAGTYQVTIRWPDPKVKPTDAQKMTGMFNDPPDLLKGKYENKAKSGLKAEITSSTTDLPAFELTTK